MAGRGRETLHRVAEEHPGRPVVLLTGAGTTTTNDAIETVRGIEAAVDEAVADGVPVQHVHWWSAIDGYEGWAGFGARSGLFDRDRNPTAVEALGTASDRRPMPTDRAREAQRPR